MKMKALMPPDWKPKRIYPIHTKKGKAQREAFKKRWGLYPDEI